MDAGLPPPTYNVLSGFENAEFFNSSSSAFKRFATSNCPGGFEKNPQYKHFDLQNGI